MIFVCSSTLNKDIHIIVIKLPENLDQSRPKARGLFFSSSFFLLSLYPCLFLFFSFFSASPFLLQKQLLSSAGSFVGSFVYRGAQ